MNINTRYDRDTLYWNDYYSKEMAPPVNSLFSEFVWDNYLAGEKGRLLDLGCGNGRDTIFFAKKGFRVTAIDASHRAIGQLQNEKAYKDRVKYVCGDFVGYNDNLEYDYCYSRFSVHAISAEQQGELIENVYALLKPGGCFFVECRSVNDEIYGMGRQIDEDSFVYDGHYRRFIRIEKMMEGLINAGFYIDFAAEKKGFAPYKEEDPFVIRIVGRKY